MLTSSATSSGHAREVSASVPAIVLCQTVTGYATARALARNAIDVHAFLLDRHDPTRFSRLVRKVPCYGMDSNEAEQVAFLSDYAQRLGTRPVVFPCGDAQALLLARNAPRLSPYCRLWSTSYEDLSRIINKNELYEQVRSAGLPLVPGISTPSFEQLKDWSAQNEAPYILKPSYEGVGSCSLRAKNRIIATRENLLQYASVHGTQSLVIQRVLRGGDGNIFDCYGLCDRDGRVVCLTSHHRLRQNPPDFGATNFGEIPAPLPWAEEKALFDFTEAFFRSVHFHGIFGIEWLRDQQTGRFYLIDVNARPFLTIGHLDDCGVNLPLLAHRELSGECLLDADPRPTVTRKRWAYIMKDIETFRMIRPAGRIDTVAWLRSLAQCRSFAYCNWSDPLPGAYALMQIAGRAARLVLRPSRPSPTQVPVDPAPGV